MPTEWVKVIKVEVGEPRRCQQLTARAARAPHRCSAPLALPVQPPSGLLSTEALPTGPTPGQKMKPHRGACGIGCGSGERMCAAGSNPVVNRTAYLDTLWAELAKKARFCPADKKIAGRRGAAAETCGRGQSPRSRAAAAAAGRLVFASVAGQTTTVLQWSDRISAWEPAEAGATGREGRAAVGQTATQPVPSCQIGREAMKNRPFFYLQIRSGAPVSRPFAFLP